MTGRIDLHQHLIPPRYAGWLRGRGVRPGGIDLPSWSADRAIRFMDRHDIETGILSLSAPGVYAGDAGEARRWAREINEYAADVVRDRPARFGFFATLTLPDLAGAIEEAAYALDVLGADGVVLLANHDGRYLGDPEFRPLLRWLHDRRTTVFVHPGELPADPVPGIPTFAADFLLDTTRTVLSLILSGTLKQCDGIRFVLALAALLQVADPDKIVYGSDYPFAPPAAVTLMHGEFARTELDPALRTALLRTNALALLPRLTAEPSR
ncbi:amidohydrolase family protein [Microlunatus speluncae]|uniref:amidohydrolase family protein n=1 Tax=Microlunatus speluncae TaxID=2594267 RepID=UPI0012664F20|nr:amidohydrolase family protein [Microlunatus speluncae]